jgi:Transketolase
MSFGIDKFGKSAPYNEIYKYFGLIASNIAIESIKLVKVKK